MKHPFNDAALFTNSRENKKNFLSYKLTPHPSENENSFEVTEQVKQALISVTNTKSQREICGNSLNLTSLV